MDLPRNFHSDFPSAAVFFLKEVCTVGDSEAIDMSPADSLERAHVDRTVSEEDEIVTQDEDELEPFLDFE